MSLENASIAPTGEPFTVLAEAGFQSSQDAYRAALEAFNKYQYDNKGGTVYWRTFPEFRDGELTDGHSYWMRLLISNKDVKS